MAQIQSRTEKNVIRNGSENDAQSFLIPTRQFRISGGVNGFDSRHSFKIRTSLFIDEMKFIFVKNKNMIKSEDIFKCNNCDFRNSQSGSVGHITIEHNSVIFHFNGNCRPNLVINKGSFISHCFVTNEEDFIKNVEIIPRDPLVYTDWKVGDKVMFKNDNERTGEVLFISGNYIVISDENQNPIGFDVRKFNKYYELVLTDIEKSVKEDSDIDDKPLTKDDLVLYKTYEDDSYSLGYIEDLINDKIVKIRDKFNWRNHAVQRCHIEPFNEKNWNLLK